MQTTEPQTKLRLLAEGARAIGIELSPTQEEQFAAYVAAAAGGEPAREPDGDHGA